MTKKIRIIALYLPQFHSIPENDKWWGKGFTEWTNVGKAKPLFWGHNQPRVPADLGYYDLRLEEVRLAQADLARSAGIEGFCYWHYWFGNGKRLLETPLSENLKSGKPDFPFFLGWANHSWKAKTWYKDGEDKLLIKQDYGGVQDYTKHFYSILDAFKDSRYIKINGKLAFLIWDPMDIPDPKEFIDCWRSLGNVNNLPGFYFIASSTDIKNHNKLLSYGFDSVSLDLLLKSFQDRGTIVKVWYRILKILFNRPKTMEYNKYAKYLLKNMIYDSKTIPSVISNFDHTPRSGKNFLALVNDAPVKFEKLLSNIFRKYYESNTSNEQVILLRSWNEWAEGNYLEPDIVHGHGFLNAVKNALSKHS